MADESLQNTCTKFIAKLVVTFRKVSLYPAQHPAVSSSIQEVFAILQEALHIKDTLSVSVSPDNKVLIDGKQTEDKSQGPAGEIIPYFKNFEIESLIFRSGVTEKELEDFMRLVTVEEKETKKIGDINKLFKARSIEHIRAEQFSYVKVKKGKETGAVEGEDSKFVVLKSKLQDYSKGKLLNPDGIEALENEIFEVAGIEFKGKKKLSSPVKNILKKFLVQKQTVDDGLLKFKDILLNAGCLAQEVAGFIAKVRQEITQPVSRRPSGASSETRALQAKLSQLQAELKEISASKERIENIVRHMAEGLVVIDPQGKILMVNPQGEALLGISSEDIGKNLKEVVKDEHLLTLVKSSGVERSAKLEQDIELFAPNESTKKVLKASSAVVEDENGKTVGMVSVLSDITKQKELDRMKSNFVANVSHELRTPLVAMEKSISLILGKSAGPVTGDQEQFLSIAERNLKRLSLLINDLLDLSKLEAGKLELKRQLISIEKVISESVSTLGTWAKTKSLTIEKKVQPGLPEINIDPNRIIQALNNLIGNAIKFSPANGTITVEAALTEDAQALKVSVRDQGMGIDAQNLPKIFSRFYQAGERTLSDVGGTGIGLSITKEIVELHAGKILVESEKGKGAAFTFILPISSSG